ncbi:hypothetical protein [Streptomyces lasalocidi]|uniref:Uncharacterized protein n=1 Tax=Streptomyces lasalocidi TaxID=324833 RepID=A0A4U5WFP8_STRLS|nr:hypothetical protein [Streptomyces lasalocidi]TKT00142.1 hypothetical protein E4U91_08425 [Streptomyces lasalocidi]
MTTQRDVHDELRARLREAAGAHQPDRARMLARIERGMAGQERPGHRATRPPVRGWARIAGATAAVAGLLAAGGYAVASVVGDDTPAPQTVAVSPTPAPSPPATSRPPAPSPSATAGAGGGTPERDRPGSTPSRPAASAPSAAAAGPLPATDDTEAGPLWSDGSVDPHSNDFWAQSNVTFKTSTELTALTVQLRVAQTGGVSSAGAWRSLPEGDFTFTLAERDGFLVYTWVLKESRTVPRGEWVFAGQYDHARGGRDAREDDYAVRATADGERYDVGGDFAPRGGTDGG